MAESDGETVTTEFMTWHESNGDVHLRTSTHIMFISKKLPELIASAKVLRRNEPFTVHGTMRYSKTLSTHVFCVASFE